MREIQIDRNKPLSDQPHLGHNRFHPKIEPVLEVDQNGISEYRAATCWLDWNHSGVGFLRDIFNERFVVHWNIKGGSATSPTTSRYPYSGARRLWAADWFFGCVGDRGQVARIVGHDRLKS